MGLKGTLSDRLADFFFKLTLEVMSRALSVDRKERGSVVSKLEIEPRTPTVKLNCSSVYPWFSGSELKKSNAGLL